jgi:hypothetical protein
VSNTCFGCVDDSDCSSRTDGLIACDTLTGACVGMAQIVDCDPEDSTLGSNNGPGVCSYGEYCAGTPGACMAVPPASCDGATGYSQNEADFGPVITHSEGLSLSASDCDDPEAEGFKFRLTFYAPNGLYQSSYSIGMTHVRFRTPDGVTLSATWDGFTRNDPPPGATSGTIDIGMCNVDPIAAGWAVYLLDEKFKAGNIVCLD